ncbi:hypothetical protein [Natrinema sp. SYSU A 869]|uniref:hypothetical protein n=1 Tax=Natrinema sp. SYSU A 869 TaxID=2871694 RepID=UPI001CA431EC|nr:hypothetical protein [Natrinema sp. SYSU A 869]
MLIDALVRLFGHNLPVLALLVVGFAVEKHYVSRVTVFTNTIALNVHFLSLDEAPRLLVWYGDLGLLLGLYGFTAYLLSVKTSILYNLPAYTLYSSLPVALVILTGPNGWLAALVLASLVSLVAGHMLEEELGMNIAHWGPRPGQVTRFVETARMRYLDGAVTRTVDLSLGKFDR